MSGTVWIPAVPLPLVDWYGDKCVDCGKRFRGKGRRERYELHHRVKHGGLKYASVEVTQEEARRIEAEVSAARGAG